MAANQKTVTPRGQNQTLINTTPTSNRAKREHHTMEMNVEATATFPNRTQAQTALETLSAALCHEPGFAGSLHTTTTPTVTIVIGIYNNHPSPPPTTRNHAWATITNAFTTTFTTTNQWPTSLNINDSPVEP
jgi:hypothetical protein